MPNLTFDEKLQKLDFKTDKPAFGLLFTYENYRGDPNISFDQILILSQAKELKATAVYFRKTERGIWVPQLFIYDNSDNTICQDELNEIHKKLWSSGIVPLYYVFDKTDVRIFNGREPLQETLQIDPFVTLKLTSMAHDEYEKKSEYSAKLFENGSFWENPNNKNRFKADKSSYNILINELRKIRKAFIKKNQNEEVCNKLLVLSILVKYLEERKDSKDKHVLSHEYFEKYDGASCFCDILRKNNCIKFFEDLGSDINGKNIRINRTRKERN